MKAALATLLILKMLDGVREMRRLPVSVGLRHRPVQKLPAGPTKGRPSRDGCSQQPFTEHGPSCAGTSEFASSRRRWHRAKVGSFNGLCCPVEAGAAKPGPEP